MVLSDNIEETIKLRIIANSDSEYDQEIKVKVKNEVQKELTSLLKNKENINEIRNSVKNNVSNIGNIVNNALKDNNVDYSYNINYGMNYFPKKTLDGKVFDEGYYESLLITLGKGEGENWWCLIFPKLCLVEVDENTEYKLWFKEIIDNI